jgi:hypothetical protein
MGDGMKDELRNKILEVAEDLRNRSAKEWMQFENMEDPFKRYDDCGHRVCSRRR